MLYLDSPGVVYRDMKNKIVYLLICMLFFSSVAGVVSSTKQSTEILNEMNPRMDYLHTVFVEIGTSQNCKPCHSWNLNIHDAYILGEYDFEYVEMIAYDHDGQVLNDKAYNWAQNYGITAYPTSIFDGDYQRIVGDFPELLIDTLNACGDREVADVTASMTLSWLGNANIQVDIAIENNEITQYNGHIRACITEIVSRYDTYYGEPYYFGFLDYAFNKDISINPGGVYTDSIVWDGNEHQDNHGNNFGDISPENIQVTMGVINDNNGYVDETVAARIDGNHPPNAPSNPSPSDGTAEVDVESDLSWSCSDPDGGLLSYDVYFGTINPPPQIVWNQYGKSYDPGTMEYNTKYYWRIVAWDNHGASTSGPIWSFTTAQGTNVPPEIDIIKPGKAVYLNNQKVLPRILRLPLSVGSITIEADAKDEDSGIEKVEFHINGKLMGNDTTEPYTYSWMRDRLRFIHIFFIRVIAYDKDGATAEDLIIVRKVL